MSDARGGWRNTFPRLLRRIGAGLRLRRLRWSACWWDHVAQVASARVEAARWRHRRALVRRNRALDALRRWPGA